MAQEKLATSATAAPRTNCAVSKNDVSRLKNAIAPRNTSSSSSSSSKQHQQQQDQAPPTPPLHAPLQGGSSSSNTKKDYLPAVIFTSEFDFRPLSPHHTRVLSFENRDELQEKLNDLFHYDFNNVDTDNDFVDKNKNNNNNNTDNESDSDSDGNSVNSSNGDDDDDSGGGGIRDEGAHLYFPKISRSRSRRSGNTNNDKDDEMDNTNNTGGGSYPGNVCHMDGYVSYSSASTGYSDCDTDEYMDELVGITPPTSDDSRHLLHHRRQNISSNLGILYEDDSSSLCFMDTTSNNAPVHSTTEARGLYISSNNLMYSDTSSDVDDNDDDGEDGEGEEEEKEEGQQPFAVDNRSPLYDHDMLMNHRHDYDEHRHDDCSDDDEACDDEASQDCIGDNDVRESILISDSSDDEEGNREPFLGRIYKMFLSRMPTTETSNSAAASSRNRRGNNRNSDHGNGGSGIEITNSDDSNTTVIDVTHSPTPSTTNTSRVWATATNWRFGNPTNRHPVDSTVSESSRTTGRGTQSRTTVHNDPFPSRNRDNSSSNTTTTAATGTAASSGSSIASRSSNSSDEFTAPSFACACSPAYE